MSQFRTHRVLAKNGYDGEPVEHVDYVSCRLPSHSRDRVRIEMRFDKERNCVKLSCPTGELVVVPHQGNTVHVYVSSELHRNEDL